MAVVNISPFKTALFLLMISWSAACTRDNLVKNPDAETVPFTNEWTDLSGRWTKRTRAPLPQQGKAYFFPGVQAHGELYQDVDVSGYGLLIDLKLMSVAYTAYMRAFPQRPADKSYEVIEFRGADKALLDSFATAKCDSTNVWVAVDHRQALPKGTRSIRVRLLSDRYNGSNNDGYHDNISLTVSVAWWVYVIGAAILLLVIWLTIKAKRKRLHESLAVKTR